MDVAATYKFTGLGVMDVTKPNKLKQGLEQWMWLQLQSLRLLHYTAVLVGDVHLIAPMWFLLLKLLPHPTSSCILSVDLPRSALAPPLGRSIGPAKSIGF